MLDIVEVEQKPDSCRSRPLLESKLLDIQKDKEKPIVPGSRRKSRAWNCVVENSLD